MTTASATASAVAVNTRQRPWWLTLINGILALIIGAVLLWAPAKTKIDAYQFLIAFLGFYWLFRGVFEIVYMFVDHTAWGWKLFVGIVSIIAGGYILMYPLASGLALPQVFVLVLGIWGLMEGIVMLILAFGGGGWAAGILGALGILLGFVLIGMYGQIGSGLAMIWSAAVLAVIGGIVLIVQAFRQRSA